MKKYIFVFFSLFFLAGCASPKMPIKTITIGKQTFLCEVASTPENRTQGLMFRKHLKKNTGMLFDLGEEKKTGFWMKNTFIPLDIIWIGKEKKILGIQTAQPCTTDPCKIFQIKKPVRWVLEINTNEFKGDIGNKVEFEL